jgi:hypothetical protein
MCEFEWPYLRQYPELGDAPSGTSYFLDKMNNFYIGSFYEFHLAEEVLVSS